MEVAVAKLKVMCARSMHQAVEALTRDFVQRTSHEVALDFGTVGALQAKIAAGESADVLILSVPAVERLVQAGVLLADTRANVARTSIGVAARTGGPMPDIATPAAFKRALLDARAIAFSDAAVGGSAGVYLVGLFERMGLASMIREKGLPQQSGAEVARRVAEGKAEIGLTLIGEIVPIAGATVAGPLPAPLGNDTTYCAAVSAASGERAAAVALIAALTAPETQDIWQAAGFDLPQSRITPP
jgi:molybdate transport system substrate-binding protein